MPKQHADLVIVVGDRVAAFERTTGRLAWRYDPNVRAIHRFAIHGDRVFLLDYRGVIHCLVQSSGELIGTVDLKLKKGHALLPDGEALIVVGDREVIAIDLQGKPLWRQSHEMGADWGLLGVGARDSVLQPDYSRD